MITLQELLESRDRRARRQGELLSQYPGRALLCLTVQLPGPEKRNALSLEIARAGVEAVEKSFNPGFEETNYLQTGFEAFFIVDGQPLEVKKAAVEIEDTHPLGRLMDLDVIGPEGPLGRASIGLQERRCLICEKPARYCMRAGSHTQDELMAKIKQLVSSYE
ncbi:MAG: citrate lyase holo-[Bacteroidales bacterium]|nr:citrate lyase holo-[acyl-carrier protein] synthase [Bacteroidales bacterium]